MSAYTPPDKIEIYAVALESDINAERFQVPADRVAIGRAIVRIQEAAPVAQGDA